MFDKLPIKKEYLLFAGAIILLMACYRFAFSKTVAAWQLHKQLKTQLTTASDPGIQPAYLVRKSANLGKILDSYRTDTITLRSNAINTITEIAQKENVKLSEVPLPDPIYHTEQYIIQKIEIEGNYFGLLSFQNQIQKVKGIGQVCSATYSTVKGLNESGKNKMVMTLYFEIIK